MTTGRLAPARKAQLLLRIWQCYLRLRLYLRSGDIVSVIDRLGATTPAWRIPVSPLRLGRVIDRVLPLRLTGATCLHRSLVHFALLRGSGVDVELVLGLPQASAGHGAHAWTEIDGWDVGPPPGGAGYRVLARYRGSHPPSSTR